MTEEQLMRVAQAITRAHYPASKDVKVDGTPYLQDAMTIVAAFEEIEKIKTELWGREGEAGTGGELPPAPVEESPPPPPAPEPEPEEPPEPDPVPHKTTHKKRSW
jgi:hypothetical protein